MPSRHDDQLEHYGMLRRSGRYPWGSGETPHQRNKEFLDYVEDLRKKGLTEKEIADGLQVSTTQLRASKTIAKDEQKKADRAEAMRLHDKGLSNVAIGEQMGRNESSIRALLAPSEKAKQDILVTTANLLKERIAEHRFIDIGTGIERHLGGAETYGSGVESALGISATKLSTAVAMLQEDGYQVMHLKQPQQGMPGKYTWFKVLAPPDATFQELIANKDKIYGVGSYSEDGGRTFLGIETPKSVSSSRIAVRYKSEGGAARDGLIELRPGVRDISLNDKTYAQVRIAVDDTHFMKGMAVYSSDLPKGVDIRFNTNKENTGNKLDALKPFKKNDAGVIDPDNPFGSIVRQRHYIDDDGKEHLSALNIVGAKEGAGEEGGWMEWSKTLSSQMLSKQAPVLAQRQLGLSYQTREEEFKEIASLNNPAVKKRLLQSFSDDCDGAAVHLKAAQLPRQGTHVILPVHDMPDDQIYAPNYNNGEHVVLIRHPHGGKFEIPQLIVNNNHPSAQKMMKNAKDAVGISAKVAAHLSGADFDGDTVLVIPNDHGMVRAAPPLRELVDFDPKIDYPAYPGMKPMTDKQHKMGDVSNLITDMTIKGATNSEIARAVKHSMVVIDAEKHNLDYRKSYKDNNIQELKRRYQSAEGTRQGGADTLISLAKSTKFIPERKARPVKEGGAIDPETGKLMWVPTGNTHAKPDKDGNWVEVPNMLRTTKMAETDDAFTLSSGQRMETVYATHANKLKALANQARLEMLHTGNVEYSPSAKRVYLNEVNTLNSKLNIALKNAPLERQAQLLAAAVVSAKRQTYTNMSSADLKKIKSQALAEARLRVGAKKEKIEITPQEWDAIQAGAITNNKLNSILTHTDLDLVKQYATPRTKTSVSPGKLSLAKDMLARGYTQAEVAGHLGLSANVLNRALKESE